MAPFTYRKYRVVVLLLTFVAVATAVVYGINSFRQNSIIVFKVKDGVAGLTENEAISLSEKALKQAGCWHSTLHSESYTHDGDMFFARNEKNLNRGYTLWRSLDKSNDGYTVYLEGDSSVVNCKIVKNK